MFCFRICSGTQKITLNLIYTLKKQYLVKSTQRKTKNHFNLFKDFKQQTKIHFPKQQVRTNQRSMLICIALFILLRATQPN